MDGLDPNSFFDLSSFDHEELFRGCTYVWEPLHKLTNYLEGKKLGKIEIEIPAGVHLENKEHISIGAGTVVEPGSYIKGPCIIGRQNTIRHGAYIRGHVVTGDRCIIGHATEVKHAIFLNGAMAPHFNYVGDSILGGGVNLGAGVILANLRLDHQEIAVRWNGKKIFTKLKKLGAILGDGVSLGCNTIANPGTILGAGVRCIPCLNIGGVVPSHTLIKENHDSYCR